jgi:hypothetical protein
MDFLDGYMAFTNTDTHAQKQTHTRIQTRTNTRRHTLRNTHTGFFRASTGFLDEYMGFLSGDLEIHGFLGCYASFLGGYMDILVISCGYMIPRFYTGFLSSNMASSVVILHTLTHKQDI